MSRLGGPTQAGNLDVKSCSDISIQEKMEAESMSTTAEHVVMRGGTSKFKKCFTY